MARFSDSAEREVSARSLESSQSLTYWLYDALVLSRRWATSASNRCNESRKDKPSTNTPPR
ncbi:hypothetical protein D047_3049A, partial [Vibrio parahaemolyticus VPTS-2010_2]